MPSLQSCKRRPMACYHEAGHCLARWYFGRQFDRAVVLTQDEVRRGITLKNRRGLPVAGVEGFMDGYDVLSPSLTPAILERTIGDVTMAQNLRSQTWASVDTELAELFAGSAAEARHRRMSVTVVLLTGGHGDYAKSNSVLDTWHPEPQAKAAAALLAEQRASALSRSIAGWAAITAMARHLQEHGELSWECGSAICEKTYGWKWSFRGDAAQSDLPTPAAVRQGLQPTTPVARQTLKGSPE